MPNNEEYLHDSPGWMTTLQLIYAEGDELGLFTGVDISSDNNSISAQFGKQENLFYHQLTQLEEMGLIKQKEENDEGTHVLKVHLTEKGISIAHNFRQSKKNERRERWHALLEQRTQSEIAYLTLVLAVVAAAEVLVSVLSTVGVPAKTLLAIGVVPLLLALLLVFRMFKTNDPSYNLNRQ